MRGGTHGIGYTGIGSHLEAQETGLAIHGRLHKDAVLTGTQTRAHGIRGDDIVRPMEGKDRGACRGNRQGNRSLKAARARVIDHGPGKVNSGDIAVRAAAHRRRALTVDDAIIAQWRRMRAIQTGLNRANARLTC